MLDIRDQSLWLDQQSKRTFGRFYKHNINTQYQTHNLNLTCVICLQALASLEQDSSSCQM